MNNGPDYCDNIMSAMASQITSLAIVYSTVYSGANQSIHQSSASLAFVQGIPRSPMNSSHKGPVMQTMFPFGDVIMLENILDCTANTQGNHKTIACICLTPVSLFAMKVTSPMCTVPLFSWIFRIIKLLFICWITRLCLIGAPAA